MNFSTIYFEIVTQPLLNILQGLYNITGDTGLAIIILGAIVNLLMWPLFASAYINGQKTKVLQPLTTKIRDKYKENPQEMLKQLGEFNKKHNIRNNSVFLVLFFQLVFASGLWSLTRNISSAQAVDGMVKISGLYENIFGRSDTNFEKVSFGFLNIGDPANQHIWLPILAAFFSFLYGYYTFKIAPKPKIIAVPQKSLPKNKDSKTSAPSFDPEALQKSLEFQTIYMIPAFMLFLNLSLTTGVNIYFTTVSLLSLVRQIILTNYYSGHTDRLVDEITKSDPSLNDDDISNNLEITAPGDVTSQDEVAELVISGNTVDVTAKKKHTQATKTPKNHQSTQKSKKKTKKSNYK